MRILFSFLIILFLSFSVNSVIAAANNTYELDLTTKFPVNEPLKFTLDAKSGLNWDWLACDLNGSFSFPTTDDENSSITIGLETPYLKNLKLSTDAKQDESYRLLSGELAYEWRLFKWFNGKLTYTAGTRDALSDEKSNYTYDWNKGSLRLGVDFNFLNYSLNYYEGFNNYPNAAYYSSTKNYLAQELAWKTKQSDLILSYAEWTGDYPYDLSYTRAFWKEKWAADFKFRFTEAWQCIFKYTQMHEKKGFNPDLSLKDYENYKTYNVEFLYKPDKTIEISLKTGITDTLKSPTWVDLPDDWNEPAGEPEEDTVSGLKRSVSLTYSVDLESFSGDLSFYCVSNDYYNTDEDKMNAGFYINLQYPVNPFKLNLKIAPLGEQSQDQGSYQLELQYKF